MTIQPMALRRARRGGDRAPRMKLDRKAWSGLAFASPTLVFIIVFFLVPILLVLQMAGSDWPLFMGRQGTNLPDNFREAIDNRFFWPSVWFTLKYTVVTTVLLIGLALGIALLVQESTRWKGFMRTVVLLPSALGLASASLLFYALYSPQSGPVSPALESLGLISEPISFLGTPNRALISTVFLIVWRYTGFYMLLIMVGLQGVSADVYEAAELDGASRWQQFRFVTLPLLRPTLALCTILCVTGSLLAFDQFYILTKGGPDNSTITLVQLIYISAFQGRNDLGIAAALSIIVLIALLVFNGATFRLMRSLEEA